jgi:hypothetical protein
MRRWWSEPFAAVVCQAPRSFQVAPNANSAKIPKKTPVNSNQSTPETRTKGFHTSRPKRLAPSLTPFAVEVARTAGRGEDRVRGGLITVGFCVEGAAGRDGVLTGAGLGADAASAAATTVFAAARAPTPRALPNLAGSMGVVYPLESGSGASADDTWSRSSGANPLPEHGIQRRNRACICATNGQSREVIPAMSKFLLMVGGICAAAACLLVFGPRRTPQVDQLAHQLEDAWADHHTSA